MMKKEETIHLQKTIGLKQAIGIMSGIMVGSGIFVSPVSISGRCGSVALSLLVWILSGVLTLMTCLTYSELAGMIPGAGGEYAYYLDIIGRFPAFMYAWMMFLLANPAFYALLSLTTTTYILQPIYGLDCTSNDTAVRLLAIWVLVTIAFLNCVYVKYVTRVQTFLTATKFIALIFICILGIIQLAKGYSTILAKGFEGSTHNPGDVAMAMYSGVFTYGGWQYLFALMEEVKEPSKNVPRTTYASFLVIIVVYVMTNVAYFTVLTVDDMKLSDAVAVTFAQKTLPAGFSMVIPVFVACSTVGALNGSILGGSRIYFAAARDGTFPSVVSMISTTYFTPIPAVISTTLLSIVYILMGNAVALLEYLGFASTLNSVIAVSCVLYLRFKQPNRPRPIKLPLAVPLITAMANGALTVLGLIQEPVKNGIGLLLLATGLPVFCIFVAWSAPQKACSSVHGKCLRTLQKFFMMVPQFDKEV